MSSNITLVQVFNKLQDRFNAEAASKLSKVFQFSLTDAESFHLVIDHGQLAHHWGDHIDPNITLRMSEATFIGIISGEIDGMGAFMKGQLKAEGDVMLATQLSKLFKRH